MTEVFLKIVNMSISATYLVLAVILLRLVLKKAPKWVRVLLWGLVALRLVCPFTLESALSLIPSAETVSPEIMLDPSPTIHTGIEAVNSVVNPVLSETFAPEPLASANPLQIWIPVLSVIWLIGMALMTAYTLISYCHLRRQVTLAIRVRGNVYLSEFVSSPFVLGVFRPKIYLPYHMDEQDQRHVLAHERAHIRRRDHWWKPLGFLLLTIHWFNPLMWVAYVLLCRDIELACDEKVIKELGIQQRADYSQALLNCSIDRKTIAACPVAFGEVGVRDRVKNVLHYKKPAFWVVVIALAVCAVVAVCFLTDPKEENTPYAITSSLKTEDVQQTSAVLWGDPDIHTELHSEPLNKLIEILNSLRKSDFIESPGLTHEVSIMLLCEEHNLLLAYGNDYVEFILDSETAETVDNITWAVRNEGLNAFFRNAIEPSGDYSITATVEDVTPTGLTVLWQESEDLDAVTLVTENDYRLQKLVNGEWADMAPSEDVVPSIAVSRSVSEPERQTLSWSAQYGELPPGTYRVTTDVTMLHIFSGETVAIYAEFTIETAENSPYSITSTLTADGLRGSADYLAAGGGYNFFDYMDEEIVAILNSLTEADFLPSPGVTPDTRITLSKSNLEIVLNSDGEYVEISFFGTAALDGKVWAVKNDALNGFFTMMNSYSPENSTYEIYNVAPLEDLPRSYNLEEATIDKCVIMIDGDARDNQDVWEEFIHTVSAGSEATVRYVTYYSGSSDEPSQMFIHDLTYDGSSYTLRWFEDGTEYIRNYQYLRHFTGESETATALYDAYDRYVLTDNATATWEELFLSLASSQSGAAIPHQIVYTDLIYYPKHPQIPDSPVSVMLELSGTNIVTVTDASRVEALYTMFADAEALGYEPGTYGLGLNLIFTGANGETVTVQLDWYNDLCYLNGEFYDYGPGYTDDGTFDGRPDLFRLLGATCSDPAELDILLWEISEKTDAEQLNAVQALFR